MNHKGLSQGFFLTLAALMACLAGCQKEPEPAPDKSRPLQTTVWKLAQLDLGGTPYALTDIPQESHVGFVIFKAEDQTLIGFAGCQQVDGHYRVEGERLLVEDVTLTGSRCHNPRFDHVGDRFAQALRGVTTYRLASDDARLELMTDGSVTAVLLFRQPEKDMW
ncbi:META domain-containing protein [Pseudomonas sp. W5-01]|jgi:heat shock protein HslJ|uniref:META domain-containing protein n=1 Tax=Pseudomonas sp. W5-01 TaxID=3097454 RepID=UPI0039790D71